MYLASKYEGGRMVITFDECKAAEYYCALDSGAETKCELFMVHKYTVSSHRGNTEICHLFLIFLHC